MREISLLLLVLGLVQIHAFASDKKKVNLTPPGQTAASTEDPGSATRLLYEDPRNQNSITAGDEKKLPNTGVKATCTDNMGMIYKKGDRGYDGCLRAFGKGIQPSLPGDNKRPNSVGITIGN
ncbi:MAG: hypothetical protein ACXVB9_15965 [Bdellovibrionota bacterium]